MSKYYLMPIHDSRKSFYNKAVVTVDNSAHPVKIYLDSYNTLVAALEDGIHKVTLLPGWDSSQTTLRHVKEFLKQHGYKADTLIQIRKDYAK